MAMTVEFWGVRGSVPSPGGDTVRYGGNTACVSIRLPKSGVLVLDAGTGIRELGKDLVSDNEEIFILLSHAHWDHVQGFPFFDPIYQPGRRIFMFPSRHGPSSTCGSCLWMKEQGREIPVCPLLDQMDGAHFPVALENVPARPECVLEDELDFLRDKGFKLSRIPTNHPGDGYGYRIERDGRSVVYLTDNELEPPYPKTTGFPGFVDFCRDADVLIHDAQYVEEDMPSKHGWGHSLVSQACKLASAAEVGHLILYHHDPDRTDAELDSIDEGARAWLLEHNPSVECTVAYEGLKLEV
jgi:phosphoribosyl 1,2-cyclic phosphodiesterase